MLGNMNLIKLGSENYQYATYNQTTAYTKKGSPYSLKLFEKYNISLEIELGCVLGLKIQRDIQS